MSVIVIKAIPSADLETDDTIVFTYPAGVAQADLVSGGEVLAIESHQSVLAQAADTFTLSYGSTSVTLTYKGETTVAVGSVMQLQVTLAVADDAIDPAQLPKATTSARGGVKQAAVQADSTASDVATIKTDFNALLAKLRTAGMLASS